MSASAACEKGSGDADMPEMRVEIGRKVTFSLQIALDSMPIRNSTAGIV